MRGRSNASPTAYSIDGELGELRRARPARSSTRSARRPFTDTSAAGLRARLLGPTMGSAYPCRRTDHIAEMVAGRAGRPGDIPQAQVRNDATDCPPTHHGKHLEVELHASPRCSGRLVFTKYPWLHHRQQFAISSNPTVSGREPGVGTTPSACRRDRSHHCSRPRSI